jgi:hypothetical protein
LEVEASECGWEVIDVKKVGSKYLAVDPSKDSGSVVDLRRIWATRVPVEVVRVHHFKVRNRYDVRTEDGTQFSTGRLLRAKKVEVRR